jgi:hypothetical protein
MQQTGADAMSRGPSKRTIAEDAARYRWLRDRAITVEENGPLVFNADKTGKPGSSALTHERLDRAVDLAMERAKCVHAIGKKS